MKIPFLATASFLFVAGSGLCQAKLGETEAECMARYGPESDVTTDVGDRQVGDKAASFTVKTANGSLDVRVIFLHGLSCHESISNSDSARGLSEAQMRAMLDAQRAGFEWHKGKTRYYTDENANETAEAENWVRSDGATATFSMSGKAATGILSGELELSTKLYADAQHFYDKENGDN